MRIIKGKDTCDYVVVGTFAFNLMNVEVRGMPHDTGGSFNLCPDDHTLARIWVGLSHEEWQTVVAVLLHETLEGAMTIRRLRYSSSDRLWHDHSDYLFSFTHPQFSDLCEFISPFIVQVIPRLAEVYKKFRPNHG